MIKCILTSLIALFLLIFLAGCTLSFQNVSTIGKASDVVDTEQDPQNDIKPELTIPLTH